MRALDESATDLRNGRENTVWRKLLDEERRCCYVRYRVQRADFVEMHLGHRNAMRFGLRLRDESVDRLRMTLYGVGHLQRINRML